MKALVLLLAAIVGCSLDDDDVITFPDPSQGDTRVDGVWRGSRPYAGARGVTGVSDDAVCLWAGQHKWDELGRNSRIELKAWGCWEDRAFTIRLQDGR